MDIDSDEDRQLQQEQLERAWNAIDADQKVVLVDVLVQRPAMSFAPLQKKNCGNASLR